MSNQNLILIHSKFIEKLLIIKIIIVYLHQNFFKKKKNIFF